MGKGKVFGLMAAFVFGMVLSLFTYRHAESDEVQCTIWNESLKPHVSDACVVDDSIIAIDNTAVLSFTCPGGVKVDFSCYAGSRKAL